MVLITEKYLRDLQSQKLLSNPFIIKEGDKLTPSAKDFLHSRRIRISNSGKCHSTINPKLPPVPVGVSNRHVHLSREDIANLFGKDTVLTPERELSQPGQFAAKEKVTLVGPAGIIRNVRVLGPSRDSTQIEISRSDGYTLGIHPPLCLSGSFENSPGITIVGPKGCVVTKEGLIVAKNHIHMSTEDAKTYGVDQGETLILATMTARPIIFSNVVVRVNQTYRLDFHIDLDEANGAFLKTGDFVRVIGRNQKLFSNILGDETDE